MLSLGVVNVNALGPLRILETIRNLGLSTKFYQASSSEMVKEAKEKIENRGSFAKLILGPGFKNIGTIRSEIAKTENRIKHNFATA